MIQKIKRKEYLANIAIVLSMLAIKIAISFFMEGAFIFSDEQSYFGMADKIAKFNFKGILNSHMPGYALLLAPFYAFASSSSQAYSLALIINSILGTLSYVLIYYLCKVIWKFESNKAIMIAVLGSLSSAFYGYNYTVMSETMQTFLYLLFFVLLCKVIWYEKSKKIDWVYIGVILGFLPIVKTQALVLLCTFVVFAILYQFTEGKVVNKKYLLYSVVIAGGVFILFRAFIFSNVGMYEDQVSDNLNSLRSVFKNPTYFFSFIFIVLAEISYFVVATGIVPIYAILVKLKNDFIEVKKNKEYILFALFVAITILGNVGITIIHAYLVYVSQGRLTVYARYLDFLQPILIVSGMAVLFKNSLELKKKDRIILCFVIVSLVFFVYPNIGKIPVNTFSITFFNNIPKFVYFVIFGFILTILFYSNRICIKFQKTISITLSLLFLLMDLSAIKIQIKYSNEIANTYNSALYFSDDSIKNQRIILDSAVFGSAMKEDYNPGVATSKDLQGKEDELTFKYFLMFWAIKNNEVDQTQININDEAFIFTDKILTRNVIDTNGKWILYDKINKRKSHIEMDTLFRTSKGDLEIVNPNYFRLRNNDIIMPVFIDGTKEFEITMNFADNIQILSGENEIQCFIDGNPMTFLAEKTGANSISFKYTSEIPFKVENVKMHFDGRYNNLINEGTLYIGSIDISY